MTRLACRQLLEERLPEPWLIRDGGLHLAAIGPAGTVAVAIVSEAAPSAQGVARALTDAIAVHGANLGAVCALLGLDRPPHQDPLPVHIFRDELDRLPGAVMAQARNALANGRPPKIAPPVMGTALLGRAAEVADMESPASQADGAAEPSHAELIASLRKPPGSRSLRTRRTRFVNAHPRVVAARAEAELVLGAWYLDPAKAREAIEKARIDAASASTRIVMAGGKYGKASPTARTPDPQRLATCLANLYAALDAAMDQAAGIVETQSGKDAS